MNNKITKPLCIILCAAILACGVGATAYAVNSDKKADTSENAASVTAQNEQDESDIQKDETVYVLAGADGEVKKIIVSDWIKNSLKSDLVKDKSELENIENVKSSETYTMNEDNMQVWDAQGNDIYYQGNIEKELPVGLSVSYKLDGESISPDELAGKSGRVTIRFDYENNQYEMVEIDGKQEKIYVPFAMLTGMIFDNDIFSNVELSNGKLINDGSRTIAAGIALPGLSSNLNIDSDELDIPDYVEISADAENFRMTNTVTIATNEIFSNIDTKKLNSADELTDSLDELTTAMDQLIDGSSALYGGLNTLLDKSGELVSGINKLTAGAKKLKNGSKELSNGAGELSSGAKELAKGLGELKSNNSALNNGSKKVFNSLLGMADSQLAAAGLKVEKLTIKNYASVLNKVISSLDKDNVAKQAQETARATVTQKVNEQKDVIKQAVTQTVKEQVTQKVTQSVRENVQAQVLAAMGLTEEEYEAGVAAGAISAEQQAQITAAVDAQMESDSVKSTIEANVNAQMQSDAIKATIETNTEQQIKLLIEQNMNSAEVQAQITAALEKAKSGAASISSLKEQLDSYNEFYTGLGEYTAGVASAKKGADKLSTGASALKSGASELYDGMSTLYSGILTLKKGAPALVSGVKKLSNGAMQLSDGLKEFNEKGVKKLTDAVDGDIGGLVTRIKATVDVSKDYKSFSGISDDMDGQVKFIYRTDEIKAK